MKLTITKMNIDPELGEYILSPEQFNDLAYHPFIQSQRWDVAVIDVCDDINTSFVSQLIKRGTKMIPVFDKNRPITPRQLLLLLAMFPDHRTALVNAQQQGAEELQTLLREMSEQYMWRIN